MKKLVTVRQLIYILIVSMVTLKVLLLPSLLAKDIGRDSYLFILTFLLFDFLILILFIFIFNKYPDLSFYQIIQKIFGTVIAKIIMFCFFVFFFIKCWGVFQTNYNYLNENLYTNLNWLTFSLPILFGVMYMSKFGVNAASRLMEVCFPIIVLGFILALTVGLYRADFSNLLPFCENGYFFHLPKMLRYSFWFGDYVVFIVFFGNIKQEKKQNVKILVSVLVSIFVVAFFMAIVYAVFDYNATSHSNAISDILQIIPASSDIGNFDWVLILIWDISLFLYFTFNSLCAFYSFRQVFFKKWQLFTITAILLLVLGVNLFTSFDIHNSVIFVQNYAWPFLFIIQYVVPIIIFLFSFKLKRRDNAKVFMEK